MQGSAAAKMTITAKPFLKWAGGKGQLIGDIERRLPKGLISGETDTYIEPFIGGGAVFFHIAEKFPHIKQFVLIDINQDLVNCYLAIKEDVEDVIQQLRRMSNDYLGLREEGRKELFLGIREEFNNEREHVSDAVTAARLIFLNKTCFNGLYRVNNRGQFNVPFGKYENPKICDEKNLRNVAKILRCAEILCGDFTLAREYIDDSSFFYFDPPYRPISRTASFTAYSKENFSDEDQIRLAKFCREVDEGGGKFLLSNSDPGDGFFEKQYKSFKIKRVKASRAINCKAEGRGEINELLITNY